MHLTPIRRAGCRRIRRRPGSKLSSVVENIAPQRPASPALGRLAARAARLPETPATLAVLAVAAAAIGFNHLVGLRFLQPDYEIIAPLAVAALVYAACAQTRELRAIGEIAFYLALYWMFTVSAVRLTYLAFAAGFPIADPTFARADSALGFDWMAWRAFLHAHPWLLETLDRCYKSHMGQALAAICLLSVFDPRRGNAFLLTALGLGALLTSAVFMLAPACGPAGGFGLAFPTAHVVAALRGASDGAPLPLTGIVAFPSFHAVMAICYACAYRHVKLLLAPAVLLNLGMLAAVPFSGNHYLVDVAGGAVVAGLALWAADRAVASRTKFNQPA